MNLPLKMLFTFTEVTYGVVQGLEHLIHLQNNNINSKKSAKHRQNIVVSKILSHVVLPLSFKYKFVIISMPSAEEISLDGL